MHTLAPTAHSDELVIPRLPAIEQGDPLARLFRLECGSEFDLLPRPAADTHLNIEFPVAAVRVDDTARAERRGTRHAVAGRAGPRGALDRVLPLERPVLGVGVDVAVGAAGIDGPVGADRGRARVKDSLGGVAPLERAVRAIGVEGVVVAADVEANTPNLIVGLRDLWDPRLPILTTSLDRQRLVFEAIQEEVFLVERPPFSSLLCSLEKKAKDVLFQ